MAKQGYGYELRAKDVMRPLSAFISRICAEQSLAEAVEVILAFFEDNPIRGNLHETLHRAVLVVDKNEEVIGAVGLRDLLAGLQQSRNAALSQSDLKMSDWRRLDDADLMSGFAALARENALTPVRELLAGKPPVIDENADLTEAAEKMFSFGVSNLLVLRENVPVGVLREKDLFLEMAKIMRARLLESQPDPMAAGTSDRNHYKKLTRLSKVT